MSFLNKIVIVTGAGSGIGEQTAIKFAKLSARLALIDKNGITLNKSAENCEQVSKLKVLRVTVDITNDIDVREAIEKIVKEFGRIDVVVNCAGIYIPTHIDDRNYIKLFDRIFQTNLRPIALITNLTAKHLIETKGNIVNISSITAVLPITSSAYPTAKASLCQFTKCVALELAPKGVRLNCVLPGYCPTNLLINAGVSKEESDKAFEMISKESALKRNVTAEEVSELVTFLASDKAKSITGAACLIDAGIHLIGLKYSNEKEIREQVQISE